MNNLQLVLTTSAVILMAAGCGGGGGSSTPPPSGGGGGTIPTAAVKITPSNATTVSTTSMSSVNSLSSGSSVGAKGISPTGVVATGASTRNSTGLADIAVREIKSIYGSKLTTVPFGAIPAQTVNCVGGGTRTWTATVAGTSFGIGDTATVAYSNCKDATGTTDNGIMSFTLNSMTQTPATGAMSFSATVRFNQFSSASTNTAVGTVSMTGDMTLTLNSDPAVNPVVLTMSISGTSFDMTSTVDGIFQMTNYNFTIDATAGSMNITMTTASVGLKGMVTITTPTPLTATSGSIRFTSAGVGSNGSYVEISPADVTGTYCTQKIFDGTNTTTTTPNPTCASIL